MQVRITRGEDGGAVVRVQRDGPSPAEQALNAAIEEVAAQQTGLKRQILGLERTDPQSADLGRLREELVASGVRLSQLHGERAQLRMQEQAQQVALRRINQDIGVGRSGTTQPTRVDMDIPKGAVTIATTMFVSVAAVIILWPIMRALGRILERRSVPAPRSPEVEAQLTRMEQAIDAMSIEVERISEGQRFATKLLAERERVGEIR